MILKVLGTVEVVLVWSWRITKSSMGRIVSGKRYYWVIQDKFWCADNWIGLFLATNSMCSVVCLSTADVWDAWFLINIVVSMIYGNDHDQWPFQAPKLEVPAIFLRPKFQGISPQYLHFRILKFRHEANDFEAFLAVSTQVLKPRWAAQVSLHVTRDQAGASMDDTPENLGKKVEMMTRWRFF